MNDKIHFMTEAELNAALAKWGHELALGQGHAADCRFSGCTCGAVTRRSEALAEFWKLWRLKEGARDV